jgi:hypothetical protein
MKPKGLDRAVCSIRFLSFDEGGRKSQTPSDFYSCLAKIDDKLIDCRLLLENAIFPGDTMENVPIVFLSDRNISSSLNVGSMFALQDGNKIIGQAEVRTIPVQELGQNR